jgi:TonB-dependent starch-binding outer membrane protein SusC
MINYLPIVQCRLRLLCVLLLCTITAAAQNTLSGLVTDAQQQPLTGVTVALKGGAAGTVTNASGHFTLHVTASTGTLVFTFIGYTKKEVAFTGSQTINITMDADQKALGEVVVVGYGTQKKVNVVGAVSAVKVDEKITSRSLPNASSALTGLVPGLAATQSTGMAGNNGANLIIRGLGTVNNSAPLVVVDGMPDVDINTVNMNDVESISVLKDATSASVYGSRAANGVILITTKSGKGQRKPVLNFSANYGIEEPTRSYDFMADYSRALTLEQRLAAVTTLPSNYLFKNGTIDQWMAMSMIDPTQFPNTDWWSVIMRQGRIQNYNLSASGGTDVSNFFISAGVMDEKGLQINNNYRRYNARFNYDYKLRKNMNVGVKFSGNWAKYQYALADGFTDDDPTNTAGFDMQYAIAGILPYDPVSGHYGGVMAYNEDPQAYNPYTVAVNMLNHQDRQEAQGAVDWDWTPVKGLTVGVNYGLNYYNQFRWNANTPNQAFNFQTNTFGSRVYVGDNAGVGNYNNAGYKTQLNDRISYHTVLAHHHDISALFVYSEEYWYDRYLGASRNDRLYPTLHELDAALTDIQSTGGNSSTEGLRSYIGRVNYSAYDKYLLELDFRADGSSKFLPGHQYGFFPSAAVGWRFTEESFIGNFTRHFMNNGKLRVSYGGLGNNSGVGRYEQQQTLEAANYMINGSITKGFVNSKMVNTNLTWESTKVMNIGLDMGFLRNRLTTELDYYNRLTTGMNRPSDMSVLLSGAYDAPRRNIGNLRNRGVEGNFNWTDKIGKLTYSLNFNATYNRTTLEKWNEFLDKGWVYINMPYHYLITFVDKGIAQTWQDIYNSTPQGAQPGDIIRQDLNGDGRIDDNDKRAYPNVQRDAPTANYSLRGNLSWHGIDFGFLLQAATGRKDYWLTNYNNVNFNAQRYAASWLQWNETWSVENRTGDLPRIGGSSNNRAETTFWLDNMNYLRLKNIQLGYSLPLPLLKRAGISNVRIYGTAENLATLTSYRGLDPEISANKNNTYPLVRSYSVGINMSL